MYMAPPIFWHKLQKKKPVYLGILAFVPTSPWFLILAEVAVISSKCWPTKYTSHARNEDWNWYSKAKTICKPVTLLSEKLF